MNYSPTTRARHLLLRLLSQEQAAAFTNSGHFIVHGRKLQYCIYAECHRTDVMTRNGKIIGDSCFKIVEAVPDYDRMIAEYLLIKNDEKLYLNTANIFPGSPIMVLTIWRMSFRAKLNLLIVPALFLAMLALIFIIFGIIAAIRIR